MYLAPNLVSRTAAYAGDRVLTPFGKGVVVEKRATDLVVRLHTSTWVLAYGQKPTLYLDPAIVKKDPIDSPVVGGETVKTQFGPGVVLSRRPNDGQFIIESHVWQLANNCLPRFFLDPALVKRETGENLRGAKRRAENTTITTEIQLRYKIQRQNRHPYHRYVILTR